MTKRIGIIGAGMAGLACAHRLSEQGIDVELFDKGRGPGGRMSTRRIETPLGSVSFDHGAQYFFAKDSAFVAEIENWMANGVAAPWPAAGDGAWVGSPAMNSIIRYLTESQDVRFGAHVEQMERRASGWHFKIDAQSVGPFDIVVLAIPAEQALPMLALQNLQLAQAILHAHSQPCWTAMFAFDRKLPIIADVIRDAGDLSSAIRNSAKPSRSGPETWVLQANAQWSSANLEKDPAIVCDHLLHCLEDVTGIICPEPLAKSMHRWRFALPSGIGDKAIWDPALQVGLCGDWLVGPTVESAWLSGVTIADEILLQAARNINRLEERQSDYTRMNA